MPALTGLPNTKREIVVRFFDDATEALSLLDEDGATTAAGDRGAINVWIDDDGLYRAERMSHMATKSKVSTIDRDELERWLIDELPQIGTND